MANTRTLQVDSDKPVEDPRQQAIANLILNMFGYPVPTVETTSKSGNKHLYVYLPVDLPTPVRIGLQLILGSDPTREMLSLRGWIQGTEVPLALFEKIGTVVEPPFTASQLCLPAPTELPA